MYLRLQNMAILGIHSSNVRGVIQNLLCSQGFGLILRHSLLIHALTYLSSPLILRFILYIYVYSISISKRKMSAVFCWKRLGNKTRTRSTKRKSFFNFCLALASTISCHEQQEDTGDAESSGSFMTHDAASLLRHSSKNMEKPISFVKSGSSLLETWHFKQPPSVGAVLVLCLYNDFLISNFRFVERLITGRLDIRSGDSHVIHPYVGSTISGD